jgi:hypothetical protein
MLGTGELIGRGRLLVGWLETLWVIVGSIAAVSCAGASIYFFADSRAGLGVACLLLIPVAFAAGVVVVFLAVLAAIAWLVMAALS